MEKDVLSVKGKKVRTVQLADEVFNREVSDGSIYHAIRNELANLRVGTHATKTRAEVNGSRKKPWKQKGTGRARSGTKQSPIWVGGGISHGPQPRDYSYKMPKKVKRLALKSILSLKNQSNELSIVEDFTIESGRTKDIVAILTALIPQERSVLILKDDDAMVRRAGRNLPWLTILSFNRLRAHDLFYAKKVLALEGAALKLNDFYGDEADGAEATEGSTPVEAADSVAEAKPVKAAKPAAPKAVKSSDEAVKAPKAAKAAAPKASKAKE